MSCIFYLLIKKYVIKLVDITLCFLLIVLRFASDPEVFSATRIYLLCMIQDIGNMIPFIHYLPLKDNYPTTFMQ